MAGPWQEWEGKIVDRNFPLLRLLGSHEESDVFLTQYGEPEPQNAAIKLVQTASPVGELLGQWERAAQLTHSHLIRLFRLGSWQTDQKELAYVVMEYAEETLGGVLRERPLAPGEAREMLESVLDALAYLHARGLAHGHLNPSNILAVDDRLKISSDGIRTTSEPQVAWRTPGPYDPPEFREAGMSPAADIWSLGMTLVQALTQQLPRPGAPSQGPVLPDTLPAEFREMARSCLQADPKRRATVFEIIDRLRPAVPEPERSNPIRAPRQSSRQWRYLAPVAALGFAATLAGVGILHRRAEPQAAISVPPTQPAVPREPARTAIAPQPAPPPQTGSADRQRVPVPAPAAGEAVHQVLPNIPAKSRATIHGTVRLTVRVHVDPSGHVAKAELDAPGPSPYFANLALQAARAWEFQRVDAGGPGGMRQWLLRFEFTNTATRVHPMPVSAR